MELNGVNDIRIKYVEYFKRWEMRKFALDNYTLESELIKKLIIFY